MPRSPFARSATAFVRLVPLAAVLLLCTSGRSPAAPAHRIVSLLPSLTEDLFAIGAGADVVASSAYTTYPPAATRLPQLSTFDTIDVERIEALHPDLVVGDRAQGALVRDVRRLGIPVVLLDDDSYASIFATLRALGGLTDHASEAARLATTLRARTAGIAARSAARGGPRPRVFVVLGVRPIFTIGRASYLATLLDFAGLRNAAGDLRVAYAPYGAEALIASDPDAIVADPAARLDAVLDRAPWNALRAVRRHRVFAIGDADVLERPGPRYNDGLAWLVSHVAERAK